jgi:glucan phosphoethanolaminetransferase (alkaline phosphatase superfamily)
MQPHFPARKLDQTGVFKKIRDGQLDYEQVWEAYVDNLQWVLDDIALLLKNVDAETVAITSDHGDSFGEYGVYGHAQNIPIPPLKHVPWLTVSAEDSGEYKPEMELDEQVDEEVTVEERLSALGYR